MATSSIFNKVHPKDKPRVLNLVRALERSKETRAKEVHMSRAVSEFTEEQIQEIFGDRELIVNYF